MANDSTSDLDPCESMRSAVKARESRLRVTEDELEGVTGGSGSGVEPQIIWYQHANEPLFGPIEPPALEH